jgi:hypothetical protein
MFSNSIIGNKNIIPNSENNSLNSLIFRINKLCINSINTGIYFCIINFSQLKINKQNNLFIFNQNKIYQRNQIDQ